MNFKLGTLSFTFVSLFFSAPAATMLTPEKTVIACDLHKVLMEQKFSRITARMLKRNRRGLGLLISPQFWMDLRSFKRHGLIAEKVFEELGKKYQPINSIKKDFIELLNAEPLMHESLAVMQDLKDAGYPLFLLSNIAHDTFMDFQSKHPEVMSLFDGFYIPSPANNYRRKPDPLFYQGFREHLHELGHGQKTIVFIDDRPKNIEAAGDVVGIVFKSARKLRRSLNHSGLRVEGMHL